VKQKHPPAEPIVGILRQGDAKLAGGAATVPFRLANY
jgi:hypothetical protein